MRFTFTFVQVKPFAGTMLSLWSSLRDSTLQFIVPFFIVLQTVVYCKLSRILQLDLLNTASCSSLELGLWDMQQTIGHTLCYEGIPWNKTLNFHLCFSSHELLLKSSSKTDSEQTE